jgi:hypothetical protein
MRDLIHRVNPPPRLFSSCPRLLLHALGACLSPYRALCSPSTQYCSPTRQDALPQLQAACTPPLQAPNLKMQYEYQIGGVQALMRTHGKQHPESTL